ncbi:MAG: hypothetical protein V4542_14040 [Pseudomonadota bacterium]
MIDLLKTMSQFQIPALIGMVIGFVVFAASVTYGFRSGPRGQEPQEVPKTQVVQNNINSTQNSQNVHITHNNFFSGPKQPTRPEAPFELSPGTQLSFVSPTQDQAVARNLEVHAITKGLRPEDDMWLIVYAPSIRRYYPVEVLTKDSEWKRTITVGATIDLGSTFLLELFVTNAAGSAYLRQFKEEELFLLPPGHETKIRVQRQLLQH